MKVFEIQNFVAKILMIISRFKLRQLLGLDLDNLDNEAFIITVGTPAGN